jgi:hypothetical protein
VVKVSDGTLLSVMVIVRVVPSYVNCHHCADSHRRQE